MASLKVFGLIFAIFTITTGQIHNIVPPGPNHNATTTVAPNTTTTASTTTIKPTTTTAAPNTTTATTTTQAPNTTTSSTTTTIKPTTTPKPIPPSPVNPEQGKWIANYTQTNVTCIILQVAIQIDLPYKFVNKSMIYPLNVPKNASSVGFCIGNGTKQYLTIQWNSELNAMNNITFNFNKTNSSKFELESIDVDVNITFPGASEFVVMKLSHKKEEFTTPVNKSYKCLHQQTLNLTRVDVNDNNSTNYFMHISHAQIQAFRNATNQNFDEALDCLSNETPDVVPIAVGCALAALVIIVLITYLIGRRRSQARGYLSMFTQSKKEEDYIPMKNLSCFN